MDSALNPIRKSVRYAMRAVARLIDDLSSHMIKPSHITVISTLLHVFVAVAIYNDQLVQAAVLLAGFGIMDTLDGELARLQGSTSSSGALLDSVSDRVKEVIVFSAVAFNLVNHYSTHIVIWVVLALGGSILVSYIRAKGESDIRTVKPDINDKQLNEIFSGGFGGFEIRVTILVVALLSDQLYLAIVLLTLITWYTASVRMLGAYSFLSKEDGKVS